MSLRTYFITGTNLLQMRHLTVIFSIAISSVCRYIEITALLTAKYFSKYSIFFPGRKSWHLLIVLVSFVNFFIPQDLWETKHI